MEKCIIIKKISQLPFSEWLKDSFCIGGTYYCKFYSDESILDVEADTFEEAKEIAENTDGVEFIENGIGDWEYDRTEDENGNVVDE